MVRFGISKNPNNSIFNEIKQRLILGTLDLNVDQFKKGAQNSNLNTRLDLAF